MTIISERIYAHIYAVQINTEFCFSDDVIYVTVAHVCKWEMLCVIYFPHSHIHLAFTT